MCKLSFAVYLTDNMDVITSNVNKTKADLPKTRLSTICHLLKIHAST